MKPRRLAFRSSPRAREAGCDLAALLDSETMPNEAWFRWLASSDLALPSPAWHVDRHGLHGFLRETVAQERRTRAATAL